MSAPSRRLRRRSLGAVLLLVPATVAASACSAGGPAPAFHADDVGDVREMSNERNLRTIAVDHAAVRRPALDLRAARLVHRDGLLDADVVLVGRPRNATYVLVATLVGRCMPTLATVRVPARGPAVVRVTRPNGVDTALSRSATVQLRDDGFRARIPLPGQAPVGTWGVGAERYGRGVTYDAIDTSSPLVSRERQVRALGCDSIESVNVIR